MNANERLFHVIIIIFFPINLFAAEDSTFSNIRCDEVNTEVQTSICLVNAYNNYRIDDYNPIWLNGKLIFSGYNNGGNNFNITELDPIAGKDNVIVKDKYGAQYITENDNYFIYREKGRFAHPLIVVSKSSNEELKRIKLKSPIIWAKIINEQLVIIQGSRFGRNKSSEVIFFGLPELKKIKSRKIVGGNDIQIWKNHVISVGQEIGIYDEGFNEISLSEKLPGKHPERNIICSGGPIQIYENKLIAVATCGDIRIYSLPGLTLERVIPRFSTHLALTVNNGLIFAAPQYQGGELGDTRVFNLDTGIQVSSLPVNATSLYSVNNKLIALTKKFSKKSEIKVYEYDTELLTDINEKFNKIRASYEISKRIIEDNNDVYKAIEICNSVAINSLIQEENLPDDIIDILYQHAIWLSETYDQYNDAKPIFEYLEENNFDKETESYLLTVELKDMVINVADSESIQLEKIKGPKLSETIYYGSKNTTRKSINFGSFTGLIKAHEDKIYIGRWGSRNGHSYSDAASSLAIYDRTTWSLIKEIDIVPYNSEQQDSIRDIAVDDRYIYLSIEYRYPEPERINFIILDKEKYKVVEKFHVNSFTDDRIINKPYSFVPEMFCNIFNISETEIRNYNDYSCIPDNQHTNDKNIEIIAATENFDIVEEGRFTNDRAFKFYHKHKDVESRTFRVSKNESIYNLSYQDKIMLVKYIDGVGKFSIFDILNNKKKNIINLKMLNNKFPSFISNSKYIFISYGKDLIIIDIDSQKLIKYIHNFILEGFENNGNGVDLNKISRLIIDKDRLIALTFSGLNSRLVNWKELIE